MLELHPLCTLFPRVEGAEFEALVADIRANGLRHPIVRHEGLILDGGNRYRACQAAGVEPRFVEFDGDNIVSFVFSTNLHRRHLSPGQQAAIVASAQDWAKAQTRGGDRKSDQSATLHFDSAEKRAAESGASLRTQKMADKVVKADPELAKKVAHGVVSLPKAIQQVEQREGKQPEAPASAHELAELRELLAEQTAMLEEAQAEIESLVKLVDAGDQMAEARRQIQQLQAEVRVLRERQAGLMNEAAEAKRLARSWRLKLERIEKARA